MEISSSRRKLLGTMGSAGALLGLGAAAPHSANAFAPEPPAVPDGLLDLARLRSYKARRSSSWDRTGANADAIPVDAGATATLLDVTGAGEIGRAHVCTPVT